MNTFISPDLIFFILVAAFLIIRLRSVLGKKTGNEKRVKDFFMYHETGLGTDKKNFLDSKQSIKNKFQNKLSYEKKNNLNNNTALEKIYYFDKSFSPKNFLVGAKSAFQTIINSYAKGEISKIKYLLSTNVFSIFSKEIKSRIKKKCKETL